MPAETSEHVRLKEMMSQKLEEWFGVSLLEYPSSGHELDVLSISTNGVKLPSYSAKSSGYLSKYRFKELYAGITLKIAQIFE